MKLQLIILGAFVATFANAGLCPPCPPCDMSCNCDSVRVTSEVAAEAAAEACAHVELALKAISTASAQADSYVAVCDEITAIAKDCAEIAERAYAYSANCSCVFAESFAQITCTEENCEQCHQAYANSYSFVRAAAYAASEASAYAHGVAQAGSSAWAYASAYAHACSYAKAEAKAYAAAAATASAKAESAISATVTVSCDDCEVALNEAATAEADATAWAAGCVEVLTDAFAHAETQVSAAVEVSAGASVQLTLIAEAEAVAMTKSEAVATSVSEAMGACDFDPSPHSASWQES